MPAYIWTRCFTARNVILTVVEPAVRVLPGGWLLSLAHPSSWPVMVPKGVRTMEHGHESPLQIEVRWDGVVATVTATGELDIATAPGLMERLLKVAKAHPERLVLDLGSLVFVDVAGARALDATHHLLEAVCPVILRQPRPSVRKVFELTGLDGGLATADRERTGPRWDTFRS